jgi:hypothetical protein
MLLVVCVQLWVCPLQYYTYCMLGYICYMYGVSENWLVHLSAHELGCCKQGSHMHINILL